METILLLKRWCLPSFLAASIMEVGDGFVQKWILDIEKIKFFRFFFINRRNGLS